MQHLPTARRSASVRRWPRGRDPERHGRAIRKAGVGDWHPGRPERPILADWAAAAARLRAGHWHSYRLGFDKSGIEVLQKNRKEEAEMWGQLVRDGIAPRSQALEALGLPFDASDEVRHMPISVIEVPIGMTMLEAEEERTPEPEPPVLAVPPVVGGEEEEDEDEDDGDQP